MLKVIMFDIWRKMSRVTDGCREVGGGDDGGSEGGVAELAHTLPPNQITDPHGSSNPLRVF